MDGSDSVKGCQLLLPLPLPPAAGILTLSLSHSHTHLFPLIYLFIYYYYDNYIPKMTVASPAFLLWPLRFLTTVPLSFDQPLFYSTFIHFPFQLSYL